MPKPAIARIAFAAAAALHVACGNGDATTDWRDKPRTPSGEVDRASLAALVNGEPIYLEDVRALMEAADADAGVDAGLTPDGAVDALIGEQLLVQEAARRGEGGIDVDVERERAMARRVIEEIRDRVTAQSIDEKRLRAAYQRQKARFVHGPRRRVVHAVAMFPKRNVDDPAAERVADEIARETSGAKTEAAFRERARGFVGRAGVKVKIETLPPFAEDERRFVDEFRKAAFSVPRVGERSPPFRTPFGWHVLLLLEELPAADVPFEKARAALAEEMLPGERKKAFDALIDRLERERGVFLYETPRPPVRGEAP